MQQTKFLFTNSLASGSYQINQQMILIL